MDRTITAFYKAAVKKIWLVFLCAAVGLGAGLILSLQNRVLYSATATLLALDTDIVQFGQSATSEDLNISEKVANVFVAVVDSDAVAVDASKRLSNASIHISPEAVRAMVAAEKPAGSAIIRLKADSVYRDQVVPVANAAAAALANAVAERTGANYIDILDEARTITADAGTPVWTYLLIGLTSGVITGAAAVYFLIALDKKIRSADDLFDLPGVKVILMPDHLID